MGYNAGDIIDRRYRLIRKLGQGSFGEVWLAMDTFTDVVLAVKIYSSLDNRGLKDFKLEFKNVRALSHPNLLRPDQYALNGASPYLVMTYCPGSLASRIERMNERDMWRLIRDVASGLAYLHAHDIVHRDIKPDNILQNEEGVYVISDFGLSHSLRASLQRVSGECNSNPLSGTIGYMAPELFDNDPKAVKASDIWALGVSLYEVATGELPFCGQGGNMQRSGGELPSLPARLYSSELNSLIRRCMSLQPWDRPMAEEIKEIAESHFGKPSALHHADAGDCDERIRELKRDKEALLKQIHAMRHEKAPAAKSPKPWIAILAGLLVLAIVGMGVLAVCYNNERRENIGLLWDNYRADEAIADISNALYSKEMGQPSYMPDWTSTNHDHNSASQTNYEFYALPGDAISFDYLADCELGCDRLTVTLFSPGGEDEELVSTSSYNFKGHKEKKIQAAGAYRLVAKYAKDYSVHSGADRASVTNVTLSKGPMSCIKDIIDVYNGDEYDENGDYEVVVEVIEEAVPDSCAVISE